LASVGPAVAHPVPRQAHECTVEVRLSPKSVLVQYRLDLDGTTAQLDLKDNLPEDEWRRLDSPRAFYQAFTRVQGPLLADSLNARIDGRKLTLNCVRSGYEILDHLQCNFEFTAPWEVADGAPHRFTFRDANYDQESGRVRVQLRAEEGLALSDALVADEALQSRALLDLRPGDDSRLRRVAATVKLAPAETPPVSSPEPAQDRPVAGGIEWPSVVALLVLLVVGIGAVVRRRLRTLP
jgi:hypothetical protein